MSKTKVSASAIALPSRRLFLASGPAAAVFASLLKATAEESPISALIRRHKAAWQALNDARACWDLEEDDPRRPALEREWERRRVAEEDAILQICSCPARTRQAESAKAEYLTRYFETGADPTEEHIVVLLRSLVG